MTTLAVVCFFFKKHKSMWLRKITYKNSPILLETSVTAHGTKMRRLAFVLFIFVCNADKFLDEWPSSHLQQAPNTPLNGKHLRLITLPVKYFVSYSLYAYVDLISFGGINITWWIDPRNLWWEKECDWSCRSDCRTRSPRTRLALSSL